MWGEMANTSPCNSAQKQEGCHTGVCDRNLTHGCGQHRRGLPGSLLEEATIFSSLVVDLVIGWDRRAHTLPLHMAKASSLHGVLKVVGILTQRLRASSGGWKSEIKVPGWSGSSESSLGSQMATFSLSVHMTPSHRPFSLHRPAHCPPEFHLRAEMY